MPASGGFWRFPALTGEAGLRRKAVVGATGEERQEPTFEKPMAKQLLAIRQLSASGRAVSDADRGL